MVKMFPWYLVESIESNMTINYATTQLNYACVLMVHLDWSLGGLTRLLCVSSLLAGSSSLSYNTPTHTDPSPRLAAKDGRSARASVRVCLCSSGALRV